MYFCEYIMYVYLFLLCMLCYSGFELILLSTEYKMLSLYLIGREKCKHEIYKLCALLINENTLLMNQFPT